MAGAFCVYGVSRTLCRKQAAKKVPEYTHGESGGKKVVNVLSAPAWGDLVKAEGDKIFEASIKRAKISPEFDAPQFARDWIAAQPSDVKDTVVMCRAPKLDKLGAVVMKLGAVVMTWVEWDDAKVWPRPFGEGA